MIGYKDDTKVETDWYVEKHKTVKGMARFLERLLHIQKSLKTVTSTTYIRERKGTSLLKC